MFKERLAYIMSVLVWLTPGVAQAREQGAALLALLNPRFPVSSAVKLLQGSERPRVHFLYGTFGNDWNNLSTLLIGLKRRPTLGIYLTCEPCRRPRRNGTLEHFAPNYTVNGLNKTLALRATHPKRVALEQKWRQRVGQILDRIALYPGYKWVIYPGLEDKWSPRAHRALNTILKQELKTRAPNLASVGRNPLDPTYGSKRLEIHLYNKNAIVRLRPGSVVTGDGLLFDPKPNIVKLMKSRRVAWLAWRPHWQGLPRTSGVVQVPIANRVFKITPADIRYYKRAWR